MNRLRSFPYPALAAALFLALAPLVPGCAAHRTSGGRPADSGHPSAVPAEADAFAARVSGRILAALVEANGVPGMSAAVWRDGGIVWTGSAGYRDRELNLPVDENTVFRLASVSKLFAVTAAARLREQGALNVDAPVRSIVSYLPDRWPAITATQLAAHTAGIPHYQAVDLARGRRRFASVREAVGVFQDRDLLFAPRTRYSYSSWGYTLLSAVVEESARRPYLDYLAHEITPGLTIGPDATDTPDPNASRAYEFAGTTVRRAAPHDFSYSWGGAGLGATAPGLARFGGRLMAGEIVSRETFEWMLVPVRLADGSPVVDGDDTIGFGWRTGRDGDGDRIAHHAGATPGARSALVLFPDSRLAASLLSNAIWVSAIEQTAMMLAAPFKGTRGAAAVPCPTGAAAYQGEHNGNPVSGSARVAVEDGLCTARISARNAFGEWLNGFPQKDAETLTIIGLDPDGGFSRAALVTPAGVYDLRARDAGSHYVASLGGARTLSIRFGQP